MERRFNAPTRDFRKKNYVKCRTMVMSQQLHVNFEFFKKKMIRQILKYHRMLNFWIFPAAKSNDPNRMDQQRFQTTNFGIN